MAVVIKTFTTPGGKYVYDRESNWVLSVSDAEFESFARIEKGAFSDKDIVVLKRYQGQGYCLDNEVTEISHPATPVLGTQISRKMKQLTMQVTQNCNLRCKYCIYGGGYDHQRTHSSQTMPLETMKKCVDFLMAHSLEVPEVNCGFYGGEPLLEIEKIKACVDYVKENYKGKNVRYSLTTNGTLFDDSTIEFLDSNNFNVLISFDGPKELHDINRVYEDGSGSFDDIMSNVEYIKENHPVFYDKISFLSIVAPGVDYACVNDFFNANEVLESRNVMLNTVSQFSAKEAPNYDDLYDLTYSYQHMKVLFSILGLYSKEKISKLFQAEIARIKRTYDEMLVPHRLLKSSHPSGPCLPGVMRPFVTVDGSIYPCERVSEGSDVMAIGHIDSGIDLSKAETLLNVGKSTEEECINCWNFRYCMLCCAASNGGSELSREMRLQQCIPSMNDTLNTFATLCMLLENGCNMATIAER